MTHKPLTDAFIAKTRQTNCTVWIGSCNSRGYGLISVNGKAELAHRIAFEAEYGPIGKGLVIDHLCRVRNCVNPMHLEAVTTGENNRRGRSASTLAAGDTCLNGHLVADAGDLYERRNGKVECRHCRRSESQTAGRRRVTTQRRAQRVADDLDAVDGAA